MWRWSWYSLRLGAGCQLAERARSVGVSNFNGGRAIFAIESRASTQHAFPGSERLMLRGLAPGPLAGMSTDEDLRVGALFERKRSEKTDPFKSNRFPVSELGFL
eukprot:COSAG06_NODE_3933_length_4750_cov_3.537734_2_plen_104_part_00